MSLGLLKGRSQPGSVVGQPGELVTVHENVPIFRMYNIGKKSKTRRVVLISSMGGDIPGTHGTWAKGPGDVVEMLAEEATRFVDRGYATYLPEPKSV